MKNRYKNMGYGEFIDGEFVLYEDMTEDQIAELEEQDIIKEQMLSHSSWYESCIEDEY